MLLSFPAIPVLEVQGLNLKTSTYKASYLALSQTLVQSVLLLLASLSLEIVVFAKHRFVKWGTEPSRAPVLFSNSLSDLTMIGDEQIRWTTLKIQQGLLMENT